MAKAGVILLNVQQDTIQQQQLEQKNISVAFQYHGDYYVCSS